MTHPPGTSVESIRSRQNAHLKDLRQRLLRPNFGKDGLIAIEGEHLLEEAMRTGLRVDTLFLREDRLPKLGCLPTELGSRNHPRRTFSVVANAFNQACATESPQGIAALIEAPTWTLDSLLREKSPILVVLAGLQDPGNLGTIIRTAEAFGATGVLLTPGCAHPWSQKVLRASAGSSFRLPVVPLENVAQLERLRDESVSLLACAANTGDSSENTNLSGRFGFVIGNEGAGIPSEVLSFCVGTIHIPCPGPVESLNAGVAAAILLYEASRQRARASIQGKP
ncbi:MAG: RNA methyltransferase [Acidobacteriaceae bacterium]